MYDGSVRWVVRWVVQHDAADDSHGRRGPS